MTRAAVWAVVASGALGLSTCVTAARKTDSEAPRPTAPLPPAPPPLLVPEGCLASLAGRWQSEHDPSVQYDALDDGGVVELRAWAAPSDAGAPPRRRFSRDGGLAWLVRDAGDAMPGPAEATGPRATLVLTRSTSGFEGFAAPLATPAPRCVPQFPARVVGCSAERLELETIMSARFDAECRRLDGGTWTTQALVRLSGTGSLDASWPDADGG